MHFLLYETENVTQAIEYGQSDYNQDEQDNHEGQVVNALLSICESFEVCLDEVWIGVLINIGKSCITLRFHGAGGFNINSVFLVGVVREKSVVGEHHTADKHMNQKSKVNPSNRVNWNIFVEHGCSCIILQQKTFVNPIENGEEQARKRIQNGQSSRVHQHNPKICIILSINKVTLNLIASV